VQTARQWLCSLSTYKTSLYMRCVLICTTSTSNTSIAATITHSIHTHSYTACACTLLQVLREGAPEPPQQTDASAVTSTEQLSPRTMVFTNTAASCKAAHAALQAAGIRAVPYHKDLTLPERAENLAAFRSGSLLCISNLRSAGPYDHKGYIRAVANVNLNVRYHSSAHTFCFSLLHK
jgi:superfamily II DNA helicase RecQ